MELSLKSAESYMMKSLDYLSLLLMCAVGFFSHRFLFGKVFLLVFKTGYLIFAWFLRYAELISLFLTHVQLVNFMRDETGECRLTL